MSGVVAAAKVGGLVDAATVIFGSATNSENACVTGPSMLVAVNVIRCVPPVPAAGVPVIVAVPLVALGVKRQPGRERRRRLRLGDRHDRRAARGHGEVERRTDLHVRGGRAREGGRECADRDALTRGQGLPARQRAAVLAAERQAGRGRDPAERHRDRNRQRGGARVGDHDVPTGLGCGDRVGGAGRTRRLRGCPRTLLVQDRADRTHGGLLNRQRSRCSARGTRRAAG